METLYREVDWKQVSADNSETITIQGYPVPYVVFENEDDVTTAKGEALQTRLTMTLNKLWDLFQKSHN